MSWRLQEYACDRGTRSESLEPAAALPEWVVCGCCGGRAERAISAVRTKTVWGAAASTGSSEPPAPGAIDTRPLADRVVQTGQWRSGRREQLRRPRFK